MNSRQLVKTAGWTAVVAVVTIMIVIPLGSNGYLNLGDSIILLLSCVTAPLAMFVIGGVGSALADVFLGYPQYALFTWLIKGGEGMLVAWLVQQRKYNRFISFVIGVSWLAWGYALVDYLFYGETSVFWASLLLNYLQGALAILVAMLLGPAVKTLWLDKGHEAGKI